MEHNDLLLKSNEELIKICNEFNIQVKKHYKKETLINNIMLSDKFKQSKDINKQYIQNISNKEALKNKIHDIHNYLRNNGIGYGMNGLKVFTLLYGLKKIEENNLLDKLGLSDNCRFSELVKLANIRETSEEGMQKGEMIYEKIKKEILEELFCYGKEDQTLKNFLFYEIPDNIKSTTLSYLIKEIDTITEIEQSCNVNLSGKIYEYFIGRDRTAISEMGAYFTDRHIVEYIYNNLLKPTVDENGEIGTMIDMFGGSGGFTIGYINYLQENYKNINWKTEINKISHYDMNGDVVKAAALEFLCLTKELPDMSYNMKQTNSFYNEFYGRGNKPLQYKYIITNPPYGGDKKEESDTSNKNKKIRKFIEEELKTITDEIKINHRKIQLKKIDDYDKFEKKENDKKKVSISNCGCRLIRYARDNKISGNDKESCSLILMMNLLEENGTAIGVLKEGVFFDKKYKDIREFLIKNFNVRKVISIPSDQFENTSTKTSILVFDNTLEKTKEIEFYDLVVERFKEDKFVELNNSIILSECEGDICGISDNLISTANIEELLKNPSYSLNAKDYNKKTIICGDGYELVKLGDISKFLPKSKRAASYGKTVGKYNFYSSSNKIKKCDEADYNEECLIIGTGGNSCIHISKIFSCSADTLLFNSKKINNYYIYFHLLSLWEMLINKMHGSTIKHITKDILINHYISIPKSEDKINEWVKRISKPFNEKNKKSNRIEELEEFIKNKIKDIEENEECDDIELGTLCEINKKVLKKNQYEYINYIDISSVKDELINNIQNINSNFPSRAKRIVNKYDILYSTVRPNLKGYTIIYNDIKNCIASTGFVVITPNKEINPIYLYTLIKDDKINDYLVQHAKGSGYPAVDPKIFLKLKLKIPKNRQLIKDLEPTFEEIEKLNDDVKIAELEYKRLIEELRDESIKEY